jgi:levanbiose-producing levanase
MGWMNNWEYARKLPTEDWHGGMDSIVRDIKLRTVQGKPALVSTPSKTLARLEGDPSSSGPGTISKEGTAGLPSPQGGAYRLDLSIQQASSAGAGDGGDGSEAVLQFASDDATFATVGYNFKDGEAFVTREQPAAADLGPLFTQRRTASAPARNGSVDLTVFVDHSSIEVFVNGGEQTLTSLVFPRSGEQDIKLVTGGGKLTLNSLTYTPMSSTR